MQMQHITAWAPHTKGGAIVFPKVFIFRAASHAPEKKIKAATDFTDCCPSGMESSMKSV